MNVRVFRPLDQTLAELLEAHPHVELTDQVSEPGRLNFESGITTRTIYWDGTEGEENGLAELADNNPWVCASSVSVPTAASTLSLIALGPLARAGLVLEEPAIHLSFDLNEVDMMRQLGQFGLSEFCSCVDTHDLGTVLAANVMCEIPHLPNSEEIDELYRECFSRSFFVREVSDENWDTALVAGRHHAVYSLRITQGETRDLLTIRVMADRNGKLGAGQVVHAFNIMEGFEESLGLETPVNC